MAEFFKMFGVEPKTILVQILGFVVLVWGLKRWLFQPIGGILDQRSKEVKETLSSLERQKKELEKTKQEYQAHLEKIEEEHRERVAQFVKEGEEIKQNIVREAKEEAEKLIARGKEQLKREEEAMLAAMRDKITDLVVMMTRKVIGELVDEQVQRRAVENAIRNLEKVEWK